MEQTALEISREIAHKRIDEICEFEMDLIDIKGQELLAWSKEQEYQTHMWLGMFRAQTPIDRLKVLQYDYNKQMYRLQMEAYKSVSSSNQTE